MAQPSAVDEMPPCLLTGGHNTESPLLPLPPPSVHTAVQKWILLSSALSAVLGSLRRELGEGGGRREDGQVTAGN